MTDSVDLIYLFIFSILDTGNNNMLLNKGAPTVISYVLCASIICLLPPASLWESLSVDFRIQNRKNSLQRSLMKTNKQAVKTV